MTNKIEQLRSLIGEGWQNDSRYDVILRELDDQDVIDSSFSEGGRWTNWETQVFEVKEGGKKALFRLTEEVGATEMQDSGEHYYELNEVVPRKKIVTEYADVSHPVVEQKAVIHIKIEVPFSEEDIEHFKSSPEKTEETIEKAKAHLLDMFAYEEIDEDEIEIDVEYRI